MQTLSYEYKVFLAFDYTVSSRILRMVRTTGPDQIKHNSLNDRGGDKS